MRLIMTVAYQVTDRQISGGPVLLDDLGSFGVRESCASSHQR